MKPGNISIIAQGGGMGEMLKLHLHNVGLGHRMYCSYGNECDLTMPEILDYYGQDEGTRVIMMQTESFKDPAAFLEVASRITPHKPILAIKAGRTPRGLGGGLLAHRHPRRPGANGLGDVPARPAWWSSTTPTR